MSEQRFSAHGEVQASYSTEQKILHIDLTGPFNTEFLLHYEAVVGEVRAGIKAPCWASVVNVKGLALAPMQALDKAAAVANNATSVGLVATAVLFHESEALEMQRKFWTRLYANTCLPYRFFTEQADAIDWLSLKIDECMKLKESDPSPKAMPFRGANTKNGQR